MATRSLNEHDEDRSSFPVISLFLRISNEYVQHKQKKRKKYIKILSIILLICISIIWLYEIDNEIYNSLNGPFHMNSNQFIEHIKYHNKKMTFLNRILFSFYEKYFQIELGENSIVNYKKHPFLQLITEANIKKSLSPNNLYVKLPTTRQSHYHNRLPFNFQLFSIKTLKCIVRQLNIPKNNFNTWLEKSMYIKTIQNNYDQNSSLFNKVVLRKCGILIGYLYNPRGEHSLLEESSSLYNFDSYDVAIDASCSYSVTYLIPGFILCIGFLTIFLLNLFPYVYYGCRPIKINIHSNMKKQFEILGINSLHGLTDLLYNSILNNHHYRYQMFIIERNYFIIFKINFNENNEEKLRSFYNKSPFIVIPISSIMEVDDLGFLMDDENNNQNSFYFSSIFEDSKNVKASPWLHEQLLYISPNYRTRSIDAMFRRVEQERYDDHFKLIVAIEEELQRNRIANNRDRMEGIIRSASPDFIAHFRLKDHPTVQSDQSDLLDSQCSICLNDFQIRKRYAQWPCPAQHCFHDDCMLNVLRESNKCPLCRYPVEGTRSFFENIYYRYFSTNV